MITGPPPKFNGTRDNLLCAAGEGYSGRRGSAGGVLAAALGAARRGHPSLSFLGLVSRRRCQPPVELSTADLPIEATYPTRHCLVSLGRLERAQAAGPDQDHLVIAAATGLMN